MQIYINSVHRIDAYSYDTNVFLSIPAAAAASAAAKRYCNDYHPLLFTLSAVLCV